MTEDPRISEIRAELDKYDGSGSAFLPVDEHDKNLLDRIRAILDRPAPVAQPVDWPAVAEAFADEIAELNPPAPRVFFPGDTVPAGRTVQNVFGETVLLVDDIDCATATVVEVAAPSREEWQAAVDRARNKPVNPADSGHQEVPS